MKKMLPGMVCVCALLVAIVGQSSFAAEIKKRQFRFGCAFPPPSVSLISTSFQAWMEEVTAKTGGKITFKPFWGAALGKPAEHVSLVQKGMVDIIGTNAQYTPGKFPAEQMEYAFAFGPTDPVLMVRVRQQMRREFPQLDAAMAKENVVNIMSAAGCYYQIMSREPIKSIGDFKGRKVSLIGRYMGRWIEPLGAVPVVVPAQERYTMLQTRVLDADLLNFDQFDSFKIYEQAPNAIMVDLMIGVFANIMMNKKTFDSLQPELKQIMMTAGEEVALRLAEEEVPRWAKKTREHMEAAGVKFFVIPEKEKKIWVEKIDDIPAEWAREMTSLGYPGWEMVSRFIALTEEGGYKWAREWGRKK
ncbi:MAG: TRAP transporter substrate-binding protein DctP [Desulfovibrio sp.]|nr:TRAP transporter substrate-binding protein DctP [Desulfovibrio sp.]